MGGHLYVIPNANFRDKEELHFNLENRFHPAHLSKRRIVKEQAVESAKRLLSL